MLPKHNKKEGEFFERCRIIAAKKLNIPPDIIDINTLMYVVKRSIRNSCRDPEGKIIIEAKTPKEKRVLWGDFGKRKKNSEKDFSIDYGMYVMDMIFKQQYPFCDWVEYYHEEYGISYIRDKIRENRKLDDQE